MLVTMAAVALAGGAAWAMQAGQVSIPAGPSFVVTAAVVPGEGGAEVCGTDPVWDDDIRFRTGFGPEGVSVNGMLVGPCCPTSSYRVTVVGYKIGCTWYCDTTVVNEETGCSITQTGHAMGGQAGVATAKAETVTCLQAD
jgi:hypothetical protein